MPAINKLEWLTSRMDETECLKLERIPNPTVHEFVVESVKLCNPDRIFVCTDSEEDVAPVRKQALETEEEQPLKIQDHTYHFDGPIGKMFRTRHPNSIRCWRPKRENY